MTLAPAFAILAMPIRPGSETMRPPPAEFHALEIDVHLSSSGPFASLMLVNETQTLTVSLLLAALQRLQARIAGVLRDASPPSA